MGYEQGFTIAKAPRGHGEVVLQLQANRAPTLEHDTLAWGALHYGKLRVVDARGKVLASHLNAHGKTITLAFDANHAQYPVRIDPLVWLEQQDLTDPGATAGDDFGDSVALDSAGTTALVGADCSPYSTTNAACGPGATYIYTQSGGTWTQVAKLTASDGSAGDDFGSSVALNSNGTIALVGAPNHAVGSNTGQGAAYVFVEPSSGNWANETQTAELASSDGATGDAFGTSVALDGNGATALVGAYDTTISTSGGTTNGVGKAYVFTGSGSSWSQTAELSNSAGVGGDFFGMSIALDSAGDTALVGAVGANAAYLFTEPSGGWTNSSAPTTEFSDPGTGVYDAFGSSVALDSNGATALVGADGEPVNGNTYQGAAYLYDEPTSGGWTSSPPPNATLTASDGAAGDTFGASVALNSAGTTALVGADEKTVNSNAFQGTLYVYTLSGGSSTQTGEITTSGSGELGSSVALDTTSVTPLVLAGAISSNSWAGAVYTYTSSSLSAALNVPPSVGFSTTYDADYIVTNNAATTASGNVVVALPVPFEATYEGISASQGTCTYDSTAQIATCDFGTIAGSGNATAYLSLDSLPTYATLTQTASVTNGSPNLAQTGSTTVTDTSGGGSTSSGSSTSGGGGGGGAIGLWALLGLLGLAGAVQVKRHGSTRRC